MLTFSVRRSACGLLLLAFSAALEAAAPGSHAAPDTGAILVGTTAVEPPPYALITELSEGPISWFEHDETATIQARAYRVVVTTRAIYSSVYLETVALGAEGCCKQITRIMLFDLDAFADTVGFRGEKTGFQFVQWLSEASFLFQYKEREFVMSRLDQDDVLVTPYAGR